MKRTSIKNKVPALSCPVDFITIDENRARMVAFFVLLFTVLSFVFSAPVIISLLLADFAIRVLNLNAYSPLGLISGAILKQAGVKPKPVDRAPKRFAALVGVFILSAILVLSLIHQDLAAIIVGSVLILFAALESFFGFCAGCVVYTFMLRLTGRK